MAFQPHLAGVCQRLLDNEDIDAIDRPNHPPDLTPVKDLWDIMYRCIHCCHAASQTVRARVIPQESIDHVIKSMSGWYKSSPQCVKDLHFQ